MSHCGNNGNAAVKHGLGHGFFIKGPQVFNGSAAASHNHHIHTQLLQRMDPLDDAGCRLFSLYDCRVEDNPDIRIPPACDIDNILHSCPGRRCYHPQGPDVFGHRLFILRGKKPPLGQFFLQPLKFLI
jgi:hypothetical protein